MKTIIKKTRFFHALDFSFFDNVSGNRQKQNIFSHASCSICWKMFVANVNIVSISYLNCIQAYIYITESFFVESNLTLTSGTAGKTSKSKLIILQWENKSKRPFKSKRNYKSEKHQKHLNVPGSTSRFIVWRKRKNVWW